MGFGAPHPARPHGRLRARPASRRTLVGLPAAADHRDGLFLLCGHSGLGALLRLPVLLFGSNRSCPADLRPPHREPLCPVLFRLGLHRAGMPGLAIGGQVGHRTHQPHHHAAFFRPFRFLDHPGAEPGGRTRKGLGIPFSLGGLQRRDCFGSAGAGYPATPSSSSEPPTSAPLATWKRSGSSRAPPAPTRWRAIAARTATGRRVARAARPSRRAS